jgi:hypothetical protein
MLKLASLALGLLTVIAMAPSSQAATINESAIIRPVGKLHADAFLKERWLVRQDRREIRRDRWVVRHDWHEKRQERSEMLRHY